MLKLGNTAYSTKPKFLQSQRYFKMHIFIMQGH